MRNDHTGGASKPMGDLGTRRSTDLGDLRARKAPLSWTVRNFMANRRKTVGQLVAADIAGRIWGLATARSELVGRVYRADWSALAPEQVLKLKAMLADNFDVRLLPALFRGEVTDYGVLSRRLVTDNGVGYVVDAFQNLVELENMKFHGYGTGTTAEAQTDTALVTELTTEYVTNSTRPTGSQTETSANIYRTVGTLSPDSGGTLAITEHGIFSASSAGVLLDRSKFSAINLVANADSLQTTYDFTVTAGG